MNNHLTTVSYENIDFTVGKKGDRLLNYIVKDSSYDIIIISTYLKSDLKYCTTISGIPHDKIDFLINLLKQYTWTIEPSKGIKAYNRDHKPILLREYIKTKLHNLYPKISLTVSETSPNIKSYIESIHKNLIKSA